jgi:hypothetical protein
VHRTLHCAMSGAPAAARADPLLLCVVRWFTGQLLCAVRCAPNRHCRLSGAPIIGFKNPFPARARGREPFSVSQRCFSLSLEALLSGDLLLAGGRAPVVVLLLGLPSPLVSSSRSFPSFLSLSQLSQASHHPLFAQVQIPSKLCESLCRCFGSDRTPGVAPQGVFRSRTVSTTVAKWFVPIARGTMDKICRFGPLRSV